MKLMLIAAGAAASLATATVAAPFAAAAGAAGATISTSATTSTAAPATANPAATATAAASFAIVTLDQASLRAAPKADAAQHARLSAGDLLEVRGERLDHLQVYDHRRTRAGFVRAAQVRRLALDDPAQAPALLAVVRFLRDTPGAEALGIAYVAAYLKAAPASTIGAEPFDALGVMAERLARRASAPDAPKAATAALDTVATYGVGFTSVASPNAAVTLCYDGDAFRRVLAHPAAEAEQKARAALALTRSDCADSTRPAGRRVAPKADQPPWGAASEASVGASFLERAAWQHERARVLDAFAANEFARLGETTKQRLHARRAAAWAAIAFERSRRVGDAATARTDGDVAGPSAVMVGAARDGVVASSSHRVHGEEGSGDNVGAAGAIQAAQRAIHEFVAIDRGQLADDDLADYHDAALRVGASRWAAATAPPAVPKAASRLVVTTQPGDEPGRTCVQLEGAATTRTAPAGNVLATSNNAAVLLARRCTFGTPWPASLRIAADGRTAVLAVQALEAWTELWVFRLQAKGGWTVDVLPPAAVSSSQAIGYIEFAGFVPGQQKLLVAREARAEGKLHRRFEVLKLDAGYVAERWAGDPALLVAFGRWADAAWKQGSVSAR